MVLSSLGGSVEVLKAFLDVIGSTATGQAAAAICEESYTRPERWIPLDQLSIEGEKACNSGTDDKGKEQSPKKSDAIERAMGSITEKLTVDCPRLLRAGEIAIENATFATIE